MTFVIDASVTVAWYFGDEQSGEADAVLSRVLDEGAVAPAHWPLEVANAILVAARRGRIGRDELPTIRSLVRGLPVEVVPVELPTALGLIETAERHALSLDDAAYLELADVRGLGLATLDGGLASACLAAGVPLIRA